jgi:hypothetical protein
MDFNSAINNGEESIYWHSDIIEEKVHTEAMILTVFKNVVKKMQ